MATFKYLLALLLASHFSGCMTNSTTAASNNSNTVEPNPIQTDTVQAPQCKGSLTLEASLAAKLTEVDEPALLARALGEPMLGKLCQGQAYQVKTDVELTLYRAWNSTNPASEYGQWWALNPPLGSVSAYRQDYEICYQWSPLDRLTRCQLKAGTLIVIGNGQSAKCSKYLSYPASETQQLYLEQAEDYVESCKQFNATFGWQAVVQ